MTQAFTLHGLGILRDLRTECHVSKAFKSGPKLIHPLSKFECLWDTGATGTVISPGVVKKLGLKPIGKTNVTHGGGQNVTNEYLINLYLPNNVAIPMVRVTELPLSGFDLLIGMDVITIGDFAISNVAGKTTFSFRVPSIKEVDYVMEVQAQGKKPAAQKLATSTPAMAKVGRNDPCPCGSGTKFKYCHGKN